MATAPKSRPRRAATKKKQDMVTVSHQSVEQAHTANMLAAIESAALNPNVDVEKMNRLLDMYERIAKQNAMAEYNAAMSKAQSEMTRVAADAENSQTHSRYATYAALDRVLRPIYTSHGFSLSFGTEDSPKEEHIRVTCTVMHASGHREVRHVDMPSDGKGAKGGDVMTKTHAAYSAGTYGMRRLLTMVFNVAVGQDDDGNAAQPETRVEKVTPAQVKKIKAALKAIPSPKGEDHEAALLNTYHINDVADFHRASVDDVMHRIAQRAKRFAQTEEKNDG